MISVVFFFIGAIAASALAALVSTRGRKENARFWAAALVVAALIYIGFALRAPLGHLFLLESAGVVVYGFLAWLGVARSSWYLAIGWIGHVLWDMFQPVSSKTFVPAWYPVSYAGFDTAVAIWLATTLWRRSSLAKA